MSPSPAVEQTALTQRRGSALVAAVVALAVASVVLFSVLKGTLDNHRQLRTHRQTVQADWLAAAGIDRAVAKLRQSTEYTGETWRVPAEQLGDTAAEVSIRIEPTDDPNQRQVTVQADYPADTLHRSRKTRSCQLSVAGGSN